MKIYEDNYQALLRLIPDMDVDVAILSAFDELPDLHMKVLERGKYSLTVAFLHVLDDEKIVPDMFLKIRVYHDAQVAEVLSYQNKTAFTRIYTYPNKKLRYPIEKRRVNQFFSEWLAYSISRGYRFAFSAVV